MTDEEKKAIKKIDIIVKECELKFKTLGYECDLYDEDEPIPVNEYRTLLNLIEKQQKALENSIPKDSIREKIEELNQMIEEIEINISNTTDEEKAYWKREKHDLIMQGYVLKEILGE